MKKEEKSGTEIENKQIKSINLNDNKGLMSQSSCLTICLNYYVKMVPDLSPTSL